MGDYSKISKILKEILEYDNLQDFLVSRKKEIYTSLSFPIIIILTSIFFIIVSSKEAKKYMIAIFLPIIFLASMGGLGSIKAYKQMQKNVKEQMVFSDMVLESEGESLEEQLAVIYVPSVISSDYNVNLFVDQKGNIAGVANEDYIKIQPTRKASKTDEGTYTTYANYKNGSAKVKN